MIKVLFLTSNPEGTPLLNLDEEARQITQKIRASEHPDDLELETLWAVRPDDLIQGLLEHQPQIVHFSGHGSDRGEIVLMDKTRQAQPVSAEALKSLFTALKDNIRVVVLNACYSKVQAQAIAEVIDCVIGMSTTIGDEAAIIFADSFYRAIGFGRSIQAAFDQGKTAILLEGKTGASTPQLLTRTGVDPASLVLIKNGGNETRGAATTEVTPPVTSNLQERLKAIEKLNQLFRLERTIYLFVCCLSIVILLGSITLIFLRKGDNAIFPLFFGSGGIVTITGGRILRMWDRSLKFIAPELKENEQ